MQNNKKNLIIILGVLIFVVLVGGVSYAYFTYQKDVADVSLTAGEISINIQNVSNNLTVSNAIPMTDNVGKSSNYYLDFEVNSKVDSAPIYYEVYIMPKSGNTLDTTYLKTYLTNQSNVELKPPMPYSNLVDSTKSGGKILYKGLVEINNNQSTKTETKDFRLRLWIDETYSEASSKTFNFDVYLYAYNVPTDFVLPVGANLTYLITQGYTCERAKWLHKEECTKTSNYYCYEDGYYTSGSIGTNMITYGKMEIKGSNLETGDALDCDVNGNGYIDVDANGYSTERFYYVSPRWTPGTDTSASAFDSNTAVLIYYSNTYNGSISSNGAAYATDNWHGPVTAIKHLPKTTANGGTWNDYIKKDGNDESKRAIIACSDADCTTASTSTTGGSLPQAFSYEGYAGRLLTIPEIKKAGCDTLSGKTSLVTTGALKACNFLMERTRYAVDSSSFTIGPWLENARSGSSSTWMVDVQRRDLSSWPPDTANNTTIIGIRPAIEVSISQILK